MFRDTKALQQLLRSRDLERRPSGSTARRSDSTVEDAPAEGLGSSTSSRREEPRSSSIPRPTLQTAPKHTVLNFSVDDIDQAVDALREQPG